MKHISSLFLGVALAATLISCTTVRAERWELTKEARADGRFTLSDPQKPRVRIEGYPEKDVTDCQSLRVEYIHWFSNWKDGWTEAVLRAEGNLCIKTDSAKPGIRENMRILSVDYARIRYKDNILGNDEGIKTFQRRLSRIEAAVAWLSDTAGERKPMQEKEFTAWAGKNLFPEIYGYPEGFSASKPGKDSRIRGEGIRWDTVWTTNRFPRELQEVRNSGTLYRDWEETTSLFYFLYTWEIEDER